MHAARNKGHRREPLARDSSGDYVNGMAITSYSERVAAEVRAEMARQQRSQSEVAAAAGWKQPYLNRRLTGYVPFSVDDVEIRSEERRVGEECRSRWSPDH